MTSDEIKAAIGRLGDATLYGKVFYGLMNGTMNVDYGPEDMRDLLIELLEQADPGTHMELPKDADGEVVRIGDELTNPHHAGSFTVEAIGGNGSVPHVVYFRCNDGTLGFHYTTQCHHYHKPTVEDVLTEYAKKLLTWHNDSDPSDSADDELALVAEYAAKLREVMS